MNQVQRTTEALITAIEESDEYLRYKKARREMLNAPLLKEQADEFRRRDFELQNSECDIFEEADKLQQEYAKVIENSIVEEYLVAENAFRRVLQRINWSILEKLDFAADFEIK